MSPSWKGIILAALQLAIVASLAAKYAIDRARFPRAWARVRTYDPDLPIRGRYLSLQLLVACDTTGAAIPPDGLVSRNGWVPGKPRVENGRLIADCSPSQGGALIKRELAGQITATLNEPVLFFLPEHAIDPSRRQVGEELWVEVTVPAKGPPRPIRPAVKKGDTFTPLEIK
jgi:hypothetical protein